MRKTQYYILAMLAVLAVACTPDEPKDGDIEWAVRAVWQNGLGAPAKVPTRSGMATDILAEGSDSIVIDYNDYPATIDITCKTPEPENKEIKAFTLTKGSTPCGVHPGYWNYTASFLFRDQLIRRENYTFYATAEIDPTSDSGLDLSDELVGTANKDNIDPVSHHMRLTLHHTKALLRFGFKVSEKYSKIRYIRITKIEVNDRETVLADKVLNIDSYQPIAYLYIAPTDLDVLSRSNTIVCTYNIYDKDAVFPTPGMTESEKTTAEAELRKHLDREGVKAQNTFTLNSLKDADSHAVTEIKAGYYYDLRVTLNPDYLYVLSDHDNKQIVIE